MSNGTPTPDGPRKRVVLKVWRQDGVICDNAHEITWLERNGWQVQCTEKLLDDPVSGISCVLYVLGSMPGATPPAPATPAPPLAPFAQVKFPSGATQVVLVCRTTRGRVVVRPLSPAGTEQAISGTAAAGHFPCAAAGLVPISLFDNGALKFLRVGVLCVNDASPALPPDPSLPLPDAPDAEVRVDAVYTLDSQTAADPTQADTLIDARVQGGRVAAFFFEFVRQS